MMPHKSGKKRNLIEILQKKFPRKLSFEQVAILVLFCLSDSEVSLACTVNFFTAVDDSVIVSHFHTSLIFACKARSLPYQSPLPCLQFLDLCL